MSVGMSMSSATITLATNDTSLSVRKGKVNSSDNVGTQDAFV